MTLYFSSQDIMDLDLAPLHSRPVLNAPADRKAAVDAGEIVCFVEGLSEIHKQDVINSTLLAQLACNKKFDRNTQTNEWYKMFVDILQGLGWTSQGFQFTEHEIGNVAVSVDKIVVDYLKAFLTGPELAVVDQVIKFLSTRGDKDPYITLFTTQSTKDKQSNFQLGASLQTPDGNVTYTCGAFYYSTDERITNVLFTKIRKGSAKFMNGHQNMVLNEQQYAKVRDDVDKKLGHNIVTFVKDIDI